MCRVLGQHRSTQRKMPMARAEEAALTADIVELATRYGRYGYRRITALLHRAGWVVNMKRVERIWRREGLKVPYRQPKKGRLWLNDGSCIRLRPEYPNHVWSYDFVEDRTHNGRRFRMLNVIDEFTRECLASRVRFELFGRRFTLRLKVVRVVGIEPTLLSEPDFESGASTSSTTPAHLPPILADALCTYTAPRAKNRISPASFPSFSKSLRDLLCVTIYTPRNTSAMAIPFSILNVAMPTMTVTIEATIGCI